MSESLTADKSNVTPPQPWAIPYHRRRPFRSRAAPALSAEGDAIGPAAGAGGRPLVRLRGSGRGGATTTSIVPIDTRGRSPAARSGRGWLRCADADADDGGSLDGGSLSSGGRRAGASGACGLVTASAGREPSLRGGGLSLVGGPAIAAAGKATGAPHSGSLHDDGIRAGIAVGGGALGAMAVAGGVSAGARDSVREAVGWMCCTHDSSRVGCGDGVQPGRPSGAAGGIAGSVAVVPCVLAERWLSSPGGVNAAAAE